MSATLAASAAAASALLSSRRTAALALVGGAALSAALSQVAGPSRAACMAPAYVGVTVAGVTVLNRVIQSARAARCCLACAFSRRRASRAARKAAREAAIDLLGSDDEGAFAGRGGGKAVMLR